MRATRAGLGALAALDDGGDGTVKAWFPRACYVELPGGLLTLVAPDVLPGPTYIELDGPPPLADLGSRVQATDGRLAIGGRPINMAAAEAWRGSLPTPAKMRTLAHRIAHATRGEAQRSALHSEPYRTRAVRARERLREGSLHEAAQDLVGMGPGLTPSGDDALAGILLALRAAGGPAIEPRTLRLAEAGDTGVISRAFLRWAARGQALAPAHDLLVSAAAGDAERASRAARDMGAVGETSGADFLLGLTWGIEAAYGLGDLAPAQTRR